MSRPDFSNMAGFPLGLKRLALLRRVHGAGGVYSCQRNADFETAPGCIEVGVIAYDGDRRDVLKITALGRAYIDHLARAA